MKLSEFNTLAEAKLYHKTQPRLIHRDSMNSLLASAGLYVGFQAMAVDNTNPFQNLIAAFLDSTEYNFMRGEPTSTGERQIAALDSMIAAGGALGGALAQLKPIILAMANPVINPYENATEHDFAVAKDIQTRFKQMPNTAIVKDRLIITTNADCEKHNPSIYIKVGSKYERISGFVGVETAGEYNAFVNKNRDLYVDNVYGVVV